MSLKRDSVALEVISVAVEHTEEVEGYGGITLDFEDLSGDGGQVE